MYIRGLLSKLFKTNEIRIFSDRMVLGIGGCRVTCSNRNLRLRLQEGRIAEPSLQLIGGEQSHGDRAIVRRKLIG